MKKLLALFLILQAAIMLANSTTVRHIETPLIIERQRNIITEIQIDNTDGSLSNLQNITFELSADFATKRFNAFELIYTGQTSMLKETSTQWALRQEFQRIGGGQQIYASPRYTIVKSTARANKQGLISFSLNHSLPKCVNYFFVSGSVKGVEHLTNSFTLKTKGITIDGKSAKFTESGDKAKRFGVLVRDYGMDGVYSYRIPGIVTTKKNSLLAVYDVRYNTSLDLQDDIDVGLSRSTNGGRSWEKMRIIMDAGEYGGLPEGQNGIGDPSILVDEVTGDILVVAAWTHGIKGDRAWSESGPGFEPHETAQLMMTRSSDDGRTWSAMTNLTTQVKQPSWRFLLQGPGRGITMADGTLVFPIQYIDSTRIPHAGIMYSRDHGTTWNAHSAAKSNTTEAQVVEIEPGMLMLNMRDNNKKGRAISTTTDMGQTWNTHPTSNSALREPVCMASLHNLLPNQSVLGREILLFSNPDESNRSKRWRITIKASLDKGNTWPTTNQLLVDEEHNWGYSCLTMIDPATVGILYEGSTGHMVFQAIPLKDIVKE